MLLVGTAGLYLWNLSASGWANSFYAAAVQAGTQSWTAFFFGSLDSANAITVDKPPASLWVMALSGRIFGFSSWSMLAPQALMAVAAVALLWATVRRVAGPAAGLLAGAVLALTPVAVLMFKFNNPDALLVLLMVAAAWATTHAVEKASTRWLLLAGVFLGFGFLTKMLQAFLVVPGLAAAYLWAAPTTLWRRDPAAARRGCGDRRVGRLVAAGRRAVAGGQPPVHRRLDEQQPAGAGLRLQRPGPDLRRRGQRWRPARRPRRRAVPGGAELPGRRCRRAAVPAAGAWAGSAARPG